MSVTNTTAPAICLRKVLIETRREIDTASRLRVRSDCQRLDGCRSEDQKALLNRHIIDVGDDSVTDISWRPNSKRFNMRTRALAAHCPGLLAYHDLMKIAKLP